MGARLGLRSSLVLMLFLVGCAIERPVKDIISNGKRVAKSDLDGTFVYLRSLTDVKYSNDSRQILAPGIYLDSDKLVRFQINETSLDVVAVDPLFREDRPGEQSAVLLSFPVRHVDVLRKQNIDGKDTHEVEETETRRIWKERDYLVVDLTKNQVDSFPKVKAVTPSDAISIDRARGAINFSTTKQLADQSLISEAYSFLKYVPAGSYDQKAYPKNLQDRFGFFKTTTFGFDRFGRITENEKREYANRWDVSRPVIYYFSANFPAHLKPMVRQVFENWNRAFEVAIGHPVLQLDERSGQPIGDLRYNLIAYDDSRSEHGIVGYGPTVANPRTGQILKADVFIYGGALKRSIYAEREWARLLGVDNSRRDIESLQAKPRAVVPTGLEVRKAMGPSRPLDPTLINQLRQSFGDSKVALSSLRKSISEESLRCSTHMNAEFLSQLSDAAVKKDLTDEELEAQIFLPLLTHELGHNLGLRHNFMASADKAHYHGSSKSSSAMDYGFMSSFEPVAPGPYDTAALQVLYGNSPQNQARALADNYYYCTDENLFDSRYGLCEQFDSGRNLSEVARDLTKRYVASHAFNNEKGDRAHFGYDDEAYVGRVLRYLVALRLQYDHANAIAEIGRPLLASSNGRANFDEESLRNFWLLMRRRIEANETTQNPIEVTITADLKVKLDGQKLVEAVLDAEKTRREAFAYLSLIATEGERSEYDQENVVFHEKVTRGVLVDKMLSLLVISMRTTDPKGSGAGVSLFDSLHREVSELFTGIISNTETAQIPFSQESLTTLRFFNPNLRELSLELLFALGESGSLEAGEVRRLLTLEKMQGASDEEARRKMDQARAEFRALLLEVEVTKDEARLEELRALIVEKKKTIASMNVATVQVRNGLELKGEVLLPIFGVQSASGLLLRDNLAFMQDRLWVTQQMITASETALATETNGDKKAILVDKKRSLEDMRLALARYVETELGLVEKLYRRFSVQ